MDKNKLAEEYQKKVSHNCQADNCRPCYDITTAYLAGFDAAESIANAKIQELQDDLAKEQKQTDEIVGNMVNERAEMSRKITELEQQLKDADDIIKTNCGSNLKEFIAWRKKCKEADEYLKSRGEK